MSTIRKLKGLLFAVLFDCALGLASLYIWSWILPYHVGMPILVGYAIAMFLAVLPDLDVLMQKAMEGKITGTHKNIMHYPLVIVPLVSLVAFLIFGFSWFWSLVAATALLVHYVHDTVEIGPGIAWLAPFNTKAKYRLRRLEGEIRFRMTPEELAVRGAITLEEWLEKEYLRITPASVGGTVFFFIMVILVLYEQFYISF